MTGAQNSDFSWARNQASRKGECVDRRLQRSRKSGVPDDAVRIQRSAVERNRDRRVIGNIRGGPKIRHRRRIEMFSLRLAAVSVVLMFAIACGAGYSSPPTSPSPTPSPAPSPTPAPGGPASSVAIPAGAATLGKGAYSPDDLTVDVGTTVTWTNTDSVAHTSTSDVTGWNSGEVAPGGQFSVAFQTAGTFPYHCAIHPGMVGTIVVR